MGELRWPREWPGPRPTEEGWYFYRQSKDALRTLVEVFDSPTYGLMVRFWSENYIEIRRCPGQFAGPIPEPIEAEASDE